MVKERTHSFNSKVLSIKMYITLSHYLLNKKLSQNAEAACKQTKTKQKKLGTPFPWGLRGSIKAVVLAVCWPGAFRGKEISNDVREAAQQSGKAK